jgi:hypothetical protein
MAAQEFYDKEHGVFVRKGNRMDEYKYITIDGKGTAVREIALYKHLGAGNRIVELKDFPDHNQTKAIFEEK